MFGSTSISAHIARGVAGFGALAICALTMSTHPAVAAVMVPIALVSLRGCPMCWTVGLVETVAAKVRGTPPPDRPCLRDGTCARR